MKNLRIIGIFLALVAILSTTFYAGAYYAMSTMPCCRRHVAHSALRYGPACPRAIGKRAQDHGPSFPPCGCGCGLSTVSCWDCPDTA